ncbi:hypothetical protein CHARACLAT_018860 [Characodon lateralis]|uniref:Uncharacterized protein n=1 Tax=Characodon lateralis TaxID=208331 RepID=A0ABU7DVF3_9TELE|nr:hypothetical protein [Characodon lateralis]
MIKNTARQSRAAAGHDPLHQQCFIRRNKQTTNVTKPPKGRADLSSGKMTTNQTPENTPLWKPASLNSYMQRSISWVSSHPQ